MKNKRITYFDLVKGIGIILVVLGHMENISTELRIWISSFHMPLFFVVSGMLIAAKNEVDITFEYSNYDVVSIIKKKAKGIMVPYLWFSIIYIPIDIANLLVLGNVDKHTFIQNILDSATLSGVSVMWFLPALFIAEATALWIITECGPAISNKLLVNSLKNEKDKKLIGYVVIIVLTLVISVISFETWNSIRPIYDSNSGNYIICTILGFIRVIFRGICMSFHVITGFVVFKAMRVIDDRLLQDKTRGISIALGVILLVLNLGWCLKNQAVDNHFLTLNNLPLYYLCALSGSMAIILICKGIDSIRFIEFLGKNSLIIMATHLQCYILYAGIRIALVINEYVTRAKSYIYMFNAVFFTMLIEALVIIVINKFFPFIVGRSYRIKKDNQ